MTPLQLQNLQKGNQAYKKSQNFKKIYQPMKLQATTYSNYEQHMCVTFNLI